MLFSHVYPVSDPRLQTLQRFSECRSTPSPVFSYSYKLPPSSAHRTSSSFSYAYKLPSSQLLSFDILTNASGVVPPCSSIFLSRTKSARKRRSCKSLVFCVLRTLPSSVSRKSCICHSYENNRGVYQQFPFWNSAPIARYSLPTPHFPTKFGRLKVRGYSFV